MKYDIESIGSRRVIDAYPSLKEIKSWSKFSTEGKASTDKEMPYNKVLKYILFFYDRESPINTTRDRLPFEKRVLQALEIVSYPKYKHDIEGWNGYAPRVYERLILLKDDFYFTLVVDFLIFQGDKLWAKILALESAIWQSIMRISKPIDEADDSKAIVAMNNLNKIIQQVEHNESILDKYISEFFLSDEELKSQVYRKEALSQKAMKSRIEGHAREPKAK